MARLFPFRALRPRSAEAASVAAVPYDVVTTDEARALAADNPLSFLHVSRPEIDLPAGSDPYAAPVYERASLNFAQLRASVFELEAEPSVYLYRQTLGAHAQTGVAACFSIDEYDAGLIKKHERTRPDKEDDRTRHMLALGAQTGPVFLVHRATPEIDTVTRRAPQETPIIDFTAVDGVRHTLWRTGPADRDVLVAAFARIPALYIADGHHRAVSASRARVTARAERAERLTDDADPNTMLAVAFPHDQVQILPYNRVVKDLGMTPGGFFSAVDKAFTVCPGRPTPERRGEISVFVEGAWRTLRPRVAPDAADPIASLDVSVLQDRLLAPVLGIADVRTDKRIDFVGGAGGTAALEELVRTGRAAVAFSLYPVSVSDLMAVSDAGDIMPPKSTWFEPKLRDGLLIHLI
jgi:uncharacterized protein (DUF1015 family)